MYREVNQMPKCANCGILMPAGERGFGHHGVVLPTCSERCERVYDSYKFPRYRDEILAAEGHSSSGLSR
jgi:hypothetical protein